LGHLRQISEGSLALAGNLAHEQGSDQEPSPHLSGRRDRPGSRCQRKSTVAHPSKDGKLRPQIYSEINETAIPPIPPNVIEPFISAPLVVEAKHSTRAPKIVATQQDRVFLGKGVAYVDERRPETGKLADLPQRQAAF
jgi:hypothetical protein